MGFSHTGKFKSRRYHIYTDPTVKDDINQKVEAHVLLPDLVNTAYTILGNDWSETRKRWEQEGAPIPYVYRGVLCAFRPGFLVRITNGKILVLDVKGRDDELNKTRLPC